MLTRRKMLQNSAVIAPVTLAGCASVGSTIKTVEKDVNSVLSSKEVVNFYESVKGIAQVALPVAEAVDPAIAPAVNAILAITEPLSAIVQSATASVTQIASASSRLVVQAAKLQTLTVPYIKAVSNAVG